MSQRMTSLPRLPRSQTHDECKAKSMYPTVPLLVTHGENKAKPKLTWPFLIASLNPYGSTIFSLSGLNALSHVRRCVSKPPEAGMIRSVSCKEHQKTYWC